MGVDLLVLRLTQEGAHIPIALEEWRQVLDESSDLRLRTDPYVTVNPRTGERIKLLAGEADSEISVGGEWRAFLCFSSRRGTLAMRYQREFEDPQNPVRIRIASIARRLKAVIMTDAGDDLLPW